jgi:hypothetical protein
MAEFEASRTMPASSDIVFGIASRPDLLEEWVPAVHVQVSPEELPVIHVKNPTAGRPRESEGLMRADRDQLRLEWGSRGDDRYSGWLQVSEVGAGASEVTVHLSIRDDEPVISGGSRFDVPGALEEGLQRLYDDVAARVAGPG